MFNRRNPNRDVRKVWWLARDMVRIQGQNKEDRYPLRRLRSIIRWRLEEGRKNFFITFDNGNVARYMVQNERPEP